MINAVSKFVLSNYSFSGAPDCHCLTLSDTHLKRDLRLSREGAGGVQDCQ